MSPTLRSWDRAEVAFLNALWCVWQRPLAAPGATFRAVETPSATQSAHWTSTTSRPVLFVNLVAGATSPLDPIASG